MNQNRRKLQNFLIRPKVQIQAFGLFFVILAVILCSVMTIFYSSVLGTFETVGEFCKLSPELHHTLSDNFTHSYILVCALLAAFFFAAFLFSIRISHQLLGPAVPLKRTLEDLKNGNYKARVTLRQGDQFQDLAKAVNDLAVELEKKSSR